jgi:hypothetical protein
LKQEIYKEHYQFEWDHRSHLAAAINLPIAGITVVGGAVAAMVLGFSFSKGTLTSCFVVLAALTAVSLLASVVFLFRSILGYQYQRIATPRKLKEHYDSLSSWHATYGKGLENVEAEFEANFNERLAEAAEVNAANNIRKSAFLHWANLSVAIALSLATVTCVLYLVDTLNRTAPAYSVKIVEPVTLDFEENRMSNAETDESVPVERMPDFVPPKPVAPPNENIKEHVVVPRVEKVISEDGG